MSAVVNTVHRTAGAERGAARRPLTDGQRRAWFLQTRDPDDASLNLAIGYRLSGPLDVARLRAAVDAVVDRHEILRTTYGLDTDGEPCQLLDPSVRPAWTEHDLRALPADRRDRRTTVLNRRALGTPFDLCADAPLRILLLRIGTTEFVLTLVAHTIAWDAESTAIFATALTESYRALADGGRDVAGGARDLADAYPELPASRADTGTRAEDASVARTPAPGGDLGIARPPSSGRDSTARAFATSREFAGRRSGAAARIAAAAHTVGTADTAVHSAGTVAEAAHASGAVDAATHALDAAGAAVHVSGTVAETARTTGTVAEATPALGAVDVAADSGLEYWRRALTPVPDAVELPGRGGFDVAGTGRGSVSLSAELLGAVDEIASARGASVFSVLVAAVRAVVQRYSGASDVVVAVPVTTRDVASAGRIGYYGNTVLLRGSCTSADTFADLLDRTEVSWVEAFAHRTVGIDRVVHAVNPDRTAGRDGLEAIAQLGFAVRAEPALPHLDGLTVTRLDDTAEHAQLPLRLTVVRGERPRVDAVYATDRVDPATVTQLLGHYTRLLAAALAEPHTALGDLDLFTAEERRALLAASHGELVPTPPTTVVCLFEDQVRARPDAPALLAPGNTVAEDRVLTYRELDRRANRLAHWLIDQGIGTEDIVGLRLSTSLEFVVAVLAVLKAGGAYLPIDPAYPDERITYLDTDARARLVLGPVELAAAEETARTRPEHAPTDAHRRRPLRPGNLAYLVYTSGSTGQPKGVPVPHAAIAEHLIGFCAQWDLTDDDRVLQSASVSFDASLLDIFVTLTVGACLVVPRRDAFGDIAYIAELIARCGITVLHMVPSTLSTFLLLPEVREWGALRRVPVGGEALRGEVADRFATVFDAELRNHYGPTEAVVCATHMPVTGPQGTGMVPIGVPNRNVYAYVLDERLGLVPDGVVGEIYLGGAQLARGYHDRPALTAQRFVADPYLPGGRLYRTGDLARRDASGALEFVGRADEQVKVRGYRIEPAEVAAALTAHPTVGDCVVLATTDPALGTVLAAYLVPAAGQRIDLARVRAHAVATLPEYLVPTAFAVLDEIPLTEHGKLDRRALPAPARPRPTARREPVTDTEIRLARLFGQLFGTEVGADDSFFDLGGHSLLAARLVALIRTEFGVAVEVRVPFDTPTVSGLAALIERRPRVSVPLAPLTKQSRPQHFPLTAAQRVRWDRLCADGPSASDTLSLALRLDGDLDTTLLRTALAEVIGRHEILRTTFPEPIPAAPDSALVTGPPAPRPIAGVSEPVAGEPVWGGPVSTPVVEPVVGGPVPTAATDPVDLAVIPAADPTMLPTLLADLAAQVFDPRESAPLAVRIIPLDRRTHVLMLTAHHLVADHRSLRTVITQTAQVYRDRQAGTETDCPPSELDIADVAVWEARSAEAMAAQRDHWRTALTGLAECPGPATDLPRPDRLGTTGHTARFTVPATLRDRLRAVAEESGATESTLYHAAVLALLHRLGGGTDLAIGATVPGHGDAVAAAVIGPLANTVVLRTDVRANPSLRTVLDRAHASALACHGNQDIPLDLVPGADRFAATLHFDEHDRHATPHFGDDLTATTLPLESDGTLRDLAFTFTGTPDGTLAAAITLNADLYHRDTAQLFVHRLLRVLNAFADTPDLALADLDVMSAEERRRVLDEWSCGVETADEPTITDLLHRARTYPPARIALRHGPTTHDFGTLGNRLRHAQPTRSSGSAAPRGDLSPGEAPTAPAGRGTSTQQAAPRSAAVELPETGAVAIDQSAPADGPDQLVTDLLDTLARLATADTAGESLTITDAAGTAWTFDPDALAAAVADRRAVAASRSIGWVDPANRTADQRVIGTGAGILALLVELVAALADGATLTLLHGDLTAAVPHRVTQVVFDVADLPPGELPTVPAETSPPRWDLLGRNELRVSAAPGVTGTIGYTVPGYAGVVARGPLDGSGRVRPVPGARILVLDDAGRPTPPGVPGAVFVGGVAQARTVSDPACGWADGLLRTGDRAHWTTAGWLEFA